MPVGVFGISQYGGLGAPPSPWGGVAPLLILELYPLGPRSLYARFNTAPQFASPVAVGDVQNRLSWDLRRNDTGNKIEVVGAVQLATQEECRLILLTSLGPAAVQHHIDWRLLRTAGGLPVGTPSSKTFRGVDVERPAFGPAQRKPVVVDLKNREFFGQGQALGPESNGNYAVESGAPGFKKRLLRIFTTQPGEHPADPTFGLPLRLKDLQDDPIGMQKRVLEQVLRDPETDSASVKIVLTETGIAYVVVKAKMKSGEQVEATTSVDAAGVRVA